MSDENPTEVDVPWEGKTASVLIIDDNRAASAFLKLYLMQQQHKVSRSADIKDAIDPAVGVMPDMVLINHAHDNDAGWHVFNILKQTARPCRRWSTF